MGDFNSCIKIILAEEGGLANYRRDPGGLTQYGISQRSYPNLDIATLTLQQAMDIYRRDYWNPIKGNDLPVEYLMGYTKGLDSVWTIKVPTAVTAKIKPAPKTR